MAECKACPHPFHVGRCTGTIPVNGGKMGCQCVVELPAGANRSAAQIRAANRCEPGLPESRDLGWTFGALFWRYDVAVGAEFLRAAGWRLYWYGLTIPRTNWGIGLLVKRKVTP